MVWGTSPGRYRPGESWTADHVPLMIMSVALLGLGFVFPEPIQTLLVRGRQRDCGEVSV